MKVKAFMILLIVGLLWGFFQVSANAAHQERVCNLYELLTDIIANQYDESLIDARKTELGGRYEIWRSEETGSWTVMEVMPNGVHACILGTGVGHADMPNELMQRNAYDQDA